MAAPRAAAAAATLRLLVALLAPAAVAAEPCSLRAVSPVAGPLAGGTRVNISGSGLEAGTAWRCSFGSVQVVAEYDEAQGWVSCYAPSTDLASVVALNASVDGGGSWCDGGGGAGLSFQFYAAPNVSSISPASGATQGGTIVTVSGAGLNATGVSHCTFGSTRVGDVVTAGAVVAATDLSAERVVCVAPSADEADAVGSATFDFDTMPAVEIILPCLEETCVRGFEPGRYEGNVAHSCSRWNLSVR